MRSPARPGLGLLTALLVLCSPLQAQRLGAINGTVLAAGNRSGIAGARVSLVGTLSSPRPTPAANSPSRGLTPGKYVIQASAIGFTPLSSRSK